MSVKGLPGFCLLLLAATNLFAGEHILRVRSTDRLNAAVAAAGGSVAWRHDDAGIAVVSGLTDAAASSLPGVIEALPDFEIALDVVDEPLVAEGLEIESHDLPGTAEFFARQWHMRTIKADKAWAAGRLGSPGVTVAVIDTGISYTHPDLAGLVDLSRSVSFVASDNNLINQRFPGQHPVSDLNLHGTHVASTIASNGHKTAGVTQRVTLMGVKVLSAGGGGSFSAMINGLLWAADHDADVANMSLGANFPHRYNGRLVALIQQTVNYAHRKGVLVVVAAGNNAIDLDHDKNNYNAFCNAANVVCVGAIGPTKSSGVNGPWQHIDTPTKYTNYGRSAITVTAPGGNGSGRIWAACSMTSLLAPQCQTAPTIVGITGTSMAAPHVAGLAALLVEDIGPNRPAQVRARLVQTTYDPGEPGTDQWFGHGRIDVAKALGID